MITFKNLEKLGRLGNQLFQISAVMGHAIRNGYEYGFPYWNYNSYLKKPINILNESIDYSIFRERDPWGFIEIPKRDNLDLYGYFQNPLYFQSCRDKILDTLEPSDLINSKVDSFFENYKEKRITAIHLRRGDYLKFPNHHPIPPMEYYMSSIDILKDETDIFLVFSDEIEWCKENLKGDFIFSEESDEFIDLVKMSRCDNFIIANSSFSWWGSYLCKKRNKTIAPNKWVGSEYDNKQWKGVYRSDMFIL